MKKLIVAEKKSVATSIATVLGAKHEKGSYYENDTHVISWCIGHLLTAAEPEVYDEKFKTPWKIEVLPILPKAFKYSPIERSKKQLDILKSLICRSDITGIVNACDAGREGELIFRLVYDHCKSNKPIERLWISSLEESAIKEGFKNLRRGSDYDNLHASALCRQHADWIVGMNLSRLYSCIYKGKVNIGRVQTPTLAMIVARELKIKNFVKEPFYTVEITDGSLILSREKLSNKAVAESIQQKCDGASATIQSVTKQEKSESPPKLYDLTSLQRDANRLFGYTAAATLKVAQNLYEQKLLTYPRTDSRFITEDMATGIPSLVTQIAEMLTALSMPCTAENVNTKPITNNAKVTDHHAIIPTSTTASVSIESLPKESKNILLMVCARLVSAISKKYRYSETVITSECQGEMFSTKGKTVDQEGWKAIEKIFTDYADPTQLPDVAQGQQLQVTATTKEGFTQPPKHYTEDLLLAAMESAGLENMPDDAERKGIGTPATRAEAIEKLIAVGYVERKNKQIIPTEKGYALINVLPEEDLIKSPLLTAEWETALKKVESGEISAENFMATVSTYITTAVNNNEARNGGDALSSPTNTTAREIVGECPRCGGDVVEQIKSFSCSNYRKNNCTFAIWKENKFPPLAKKKLTTAIAKSLLCDGKVFMNGLLKKDGKGTYDAWLVLDDTSFKLEFPSKK